MGKTFPKKAFPSKSGKQFVAWNMVIPKLSCDKAQTWNTGFVHIYTYATYFKTGNG